MNYNYNRLCVLSSPHYIPKTTHHLPVRRAPPKTDSEMQKQMLEWVTASTKIAHPVAVV